jgi:1-acyl-sn-glycerol-3-phosphate acyltransferase
VILVRSLLFNLLFYLVLLVLLIAALPTLLMPRTAILSIAKLWGRINLWLLRAVCGTDVEIKGRDKIPPGPLLVAAKHQSAWETFALAPLFADPVYIIKRELTWLPLFGWYLLKAGLIPIDRGTPVRALARMTARVKRALAEGRQIIIFPEGTRRPPGAPPAYRAGIAHLYAETDTPCLPIALNSGLFWPRRSLLRYPGTIRVEILDAIPPGLPKKEFAQRLENAIEEACARMSAAGRQ